jgi:hypothetical protein
VAGEIKGHLELLGSVHAMVRLEGLGDEDLEIFVSEGSI